MTEKIETRRLTVNDFELREGPAGDGMSFSGYAAVFNSDSEPLPFTERILPGAFSKSLRSRNNVRMYLNHDSTMLLATTRAKTLRLMEDERGLKVEADLPDTTVGRDVAALAERGDVYQSSFAFYTVEDEWSMTENGFPLRTLRAAQLVDVAPVNSPAYLDTSSGLRSLAEKRGLPLDEVTHAAAENRLGELLSPAPVDDEVRVSADEADAEIPQVDNHGLIVVRQRLMQMRLRRDI